MVLQNVKFSEALKTLLKNEPIKKQRSKFSKEYFLIFKASSYFTALLFAPYNVISFNPEVTDRKIFNSKTRIEQLVLKPTSKLHVLLAPHFYSSIAIIKKEKVFKELSKNTSPLRLRGS